MPYRSGATTASAYWLSLGLPFGAGGKWLAAGQNRSAIRLPVSRFFYASAADCDGASVAVSQSPVLVSSSGVFLSYHQVRNSATEAAFWHCVLCMGTCFGIFVKENL